MHIRIKAFNFLTLRASERNNDDDNDDDDYDDDATTTMTMMTMIMMMIMMLLLLLMMMMMMMMKMMMKMMMMMKMKTFVNKEASCAWLRSAGLKGETESLIKAAQDQTLNIRYHQRMIFKKQIDGNCGKAQETLSHIMAG